MLLPSSVADALADAAHEIGDLADDTRWYVFGSALTDFESAHDLDLLVVYAHRDVGRARRLRDAIEERARVAKPLHVQLLTDEEDRETKFSATEGAVLVWAADG